MPKNATSRIELQFSDPSKSSTFKLALGGFSSTKATFATPVVLIVSVSAPAPALPITEPRFSALAMPVPTVRDLPSAIVALPSVIAPVAAPPTVALSVTLTALVPRLIVLAPVVAAIVPAMFLLEGAVAVTPPTNVVLSVAWSPRVTVPVLLNVVEPAIEFEPPVRLTL